MRITKQTAFFWATAIMVFAGSLDAQALSRRAESAGYKQGAATQRMAHKVPFIYYLQHLNRQTLIEINPAVAVIDPYDSGLSVLDVAHLREAYGQQLFAYISAGEADPTRTNPQDGYYFRPEWAQAGWITSIPKAAQSNDRWSTKRVAYWHPQWHAIMIARAQEMARRGYDGVMLDTVDTFYAYQEHIKNRDTRQDMTDLVGHIRDAVRATHPHFKIMVNGGMELYKTTYSKTGEPFLKVIAGQLKEDTWYNERGSAEAEWTPYDKAYMQQAIAAGVPVYSIDYFTDADGIDDDKAAEGQKSPTRANTAQMQEYMQQATAMGAIPFAADRSLGRFVSFNAKYFAEPARWQRFQRFGVAR